MSTAAVTTKARPANGSRRERFVAGAKELIAYGARKLMRDRAQQLAAALAYRTVFSLVPVLVLALIAARAVSTPSDLEYRLFKLLEYLGIAELSFEVPSEVTDIDAVPRRVELSDVIGQFASNQLDRLAEVNFGAITAVGVAVLVYAAISLVIQVEQAFNLICSAPSGRKLISRVVTYWTLLTLGAVALFLSFTIGGHFGELLRTFPDWLAWATRPLQLAVKIGATWILLVFAYTQMPNTRVKVRAAAIGAIVAAVLWEIAKSGLTWFVSNTTDGRVSVYGSLALLPIFLLWIYVTWLIVLFGLELASILQTLRHASVLDRRFAFRKQGPVILDGSVALHAIAEMARRFQDGKPTRLDELASQLGMSEEHAALLAHGAVASGLLHAIEREHEPDAYALARPAETITVGDVFAIIDRLSPSPPNTEDRRALDALRARQRSVLAKESLATLIGRLPPERNPE